MSNLRSCVGLALFALVGCSGGVAPTYPTEGRLLIGGKPAANVFILFTPVGGGGADAQGPHPSATTDLEGKFRLTTHAAFDGAPAGEYVVTLLYEPVNSPLARAKHKSKPPSVPKLYGSTETSPLKATVEAKEKNTLSEFKVP